MSIQAPQGILNIPNATLRVGRLEISEVVGADTALNTIARNTILLVDDVAYHENKNWGLKLPNAWAGEFECNTASAGNYSEFNFYNEGASSNAQGYNLTFNDTTAELRYDGTLLTSGTLPSTVTGTGVKKVRLMFERTILSVTVDGTLIFTHDDTGGPRPRVYSTTAGGFLNFFTDGGALKNLKIVNEKWISDGTSNIAYVGGGEVAVGQSLNLQQVSNTSMIKMNSNVVTEFPRSKKLIKYPRVALTSAAQTESGYEGYIVTRSSQFLTYNAWEVFDNDNPVGGNSGQSAGWASGGAGGETDTYSPTTGDVTAQAATHPDGLIQGEWIQIQLPDAIYLHDIKIHSRAEAYYIDDMTGFPKNVYLYGKKSNDWVLVKNFTTSSKKYGDSYTEYIDYTKETFTHFVLVVNSIHVSSQGASGQPGFTTIGQIDLYGTPEYDPEAHGTDVTVKSYPNVPNTDWLEVYYDAKNYSGSGDVQDESGNDRDGTLYGDISLNSADGIHKFDFDGAGDYIVRTGIPTPTGAGSFTHTVSMWFKVPSLATAVLLWGLAGEPDGTDGTPSGSDIPHAAIGTNGLISWAFWANDVSNQTAVDIDRWYHCVWTYSGGTNGRGMFLDGVEQVLGAQTAALNMPNSTSRLAIGIYPHNLASNPFNGSIANFRLFNRALSSDEIYQLYAYQKEYFGHGDLSMTLKAGRLGIGTSEPRAALDVRGDIHGGCPVFFTAWSAGQGTSGSSSSGVVIVFNNTSVNKGGAYDTSNGRCTFPISGYYEVFFRGGTGNSASAFHARIYRNGNAPGSGGWPNNVMRVYDNSGGVYRNGGTIQFFYYFKAGEYIEVRMTEGVFNANDYNSFSVKYLSN